MDLLLKLLVLLLLGTPALAQVVEVYPAQLARVPTMGRYWQQLRLVLAENQGPDEAALALSLPEGIQVADIDGDGEIDDELRLVYAPVASEQPGYFPTGDSTPGNLVVGSADSVAAGGVLYLQFPIEIAVADSVDTLSYGPIRFADLGAADLERGPDLALVDEGVQLVVWGQSLAPGPEVAAGLEEGQYPGVPEELVLSVPDLVFDGGISGANNLLGLGDGDDSGDTVYRFYFSTDGNLTEVGPQNGIEALTGGGETFIRSEGRGGPVQLSVGDLPEGVYYLYATTQVTGSVALGRSRPLRVEHPPQISYVEPGGGDLTLDSGGFWSVGGHPGGVSRRQVRLSVAVEDRDGEPQTTLFYSSEPDLTPEDIGGEVELTLAGAIALGAPSEGNLVWNILSPQTVAAGDYYIYALATDNNHKVLSRSTSRVLVRHAPSLVLDPLNTNQIITGGIRPQRLVLLSWERGDGDQDLDDDAAIGLYYSLLPARADSAGSDSSLWVPGGAEDLLGRLGKQVWPIVEGLREDPDQRGDNRYSWDLWRSYRPPQAGQTYYLYGLIDDGVSRRLTQLNGGRLNDGAGQIQFSHPPVLRPLQPVDQIKIPAAGKARVEWEDTDLDSDARIRILLCSQDLGLVTDYAQLIGGGAYVANSLNGAPVGAVDLEMDLSEDSPVDHYDVGVAHLLESGVGAGPLVDGAYFVYLAIEEGVEFGGQTQAWRAPGQLLVERVGEPVAALGPGVRLVPEVFALGVEQVQRFELRPDGGDEPVDLVAVDLAVDGRYLAAVDQAPDIDGVQPFWVGPGYDGVKLVVNRAQMNPDSSLSLHFAYFDPSATGIPSLDGHHILALVELVGAAPTSVAEVAIMNQGTSRLEKGGQTLEALAPGALATGSVLPGRAIVNGSLILEGREDRAETVEFFLRPWNGDVVVEDSGFSAANDVDSSRAGVQVELDNEGGFVLREVPVGRFDLFAHLDGYLDAWAVGLDLWPAQSLDGVVLASPGGESRSLMLGGDVAGYIAANGLAEPDNEVSLADWDYIASFFGQSVGSGQDGEADSEGDDGESSQGVSEASRADITGDGQVDIMDLALVGANFLTRGPGPVYRPVLTLGQAYLQLERAGESSIGQEVEWAVWGRRVQGASAVQFTLVWQADQWRLGTVVGRMDQQTLSAVHQLANGVELGLSRLGGASDFARDEFFGKVYLRALVDNPEPPRLDKALLLDKTYRRLDLGFGPGTILPVASSLKANYPNPFNSGTVIPLDLAVTGAIRVEIFNGLGQVVASLWDGPLAAGQHQLHWDGRSRNGKPAASGRYFYRMQSGGQRFVRPMLLLR